MAEQQSRLAIIIDSTGAQRNAEGLAGSLQGLTEWGQKAAASSGKVSKATDEEAKALSALLDKIDPVNAALNRLDEQQQQLAKFQSRGFIDTDTFDVYSKKLEETRNKLTGFNEGLDKGSISAGQYKSAIRQLPAQFSDIFTSLAGGMPLWLVFTQQGGQIADSFGGWGSLLEIIKTELLGMSSANDEASDSLSESANGLSENVENGKKLLGFLTPARIALGGAAVAVGALTYAYYKGSKEQDEFAQSLILTGNAIGSTTGQLADLSAQVADASGSTKSSAADVISQLVSTGKVSKEVLGDAAQAILKTNDAAGISTQQLVSDFAAIGKDPVAALTKLNDQYNFLTVATYNQVKSLQEEGNQLEAAKIASDTYASAMGQRADDISNSLGSLQQAWKWLGDEAKGAWDSMLNIGRETSLESRLETAKRAVEQSAGNLGNGMWNTYGVNAPDGSSAKAEVNILQSVIDLQNDLNGARAAGLEVQKEGIAAQQRIDKLQDQSLTKAEQRQKALNQLTRDIAKARAAGNSISLDDEAKLRANIEEKYKDPKAPKTKAYRDDAGQRMLLELQQQQATLLAQQATGYQIGTQQQALIKWEQQLADIKSKQTLTADQKSLLANSDLITAQLQQNAALEKQIETREKLLALDKARADIERTINNRQSQYATDELFAGGGLSQYEQQQYTQRLSLEQSYNDKITQLRQQRASATSDVAREEIDQEIQLQQQALQTELSSYDAHIQRMNEARGSFTAGASRAWQEYQDSAANVSAMSQQLFTDAFGGMEDALVNFVVTGKASFKDFATSVISDLARIAARQALVGLGSSIFGSLFSSGVSAATSAVSGSAGGLGLSTDFHAYAKGGVPGGQTISAFRNGVYDSPQYFAFAKGAGVFGEAGPEAIMPLARSSDGSLGVRMISGGGSSSINVNAPVTIVQQSDGSSGDVSNTNTAAAGKQLEAIVQTTLTERLRKEIAPGGLLYRPARG